MASSVGYYKTEYMYATYTRGCVDELNTKLQEVGWPVEGEVSLQTQTYGPYENVCIVTDTTINAGY
jgi:hypothetical protein